ncbi:phenylalanine--tRNA ligase subunit alpha [archaeon]|nr:phenylalanine--tRNA ligase subunit alpha [archaeon]
MLQTRKIISKLHPLERRVLPYLKQGITTNEIIEKTRMKEVEAMRALQWLENKGILKLDSETYGLITLERLGAVYCKKGLPEQKLLQEIREGEILLKEILGKENPRLNKLNLSRQEISAALGVLKQKGALEIKEGRACITELGKKLIADNKEREFLGKLPKRINELDKEEQAIFESLKQRKEIIALNIAKTRRIHLSELGMQLSKARLSQELIETLTPQMLQDCSWKNREFRHFDVEINVPAITIGKRQPYAEFLNQIKIKLAELGFEEMTGPLVELEFYNFDVLFQPQNHPARTWSECYRLKSPVYGVLPRQHIVKAVKEAHENGWGYKWNEKISSQLMLRAQGTALSARQLVKGMKIPGKYFALARCYRPDILDATHLIEFNQLEGIVADKGLTFRNLLGLLKQFAIEVAGAKAVRFMPDYYPFTEPSVQMNALHPILGWIELGGAGIFRPEVCRTQNIQVPVIAWGLGIDRLAMFKLGINDIRNLFSQDLNWLRNAGGAYA